MSVSQRPRSTLQAAEVRCLRAGRVVRVLAVAVLVLVIFRVWTANLPADSHRSNIVRHNLYLHCEDEPQGDTKTVQESEPPRSQTSHQPTQPTKNPKKSTRPARTHGQGHEGIERGCQTRHSNSNLSNLCRYGHTARAPAHGHGHATDGHGHELLALFG